MNNSHSLMNLFWGTGSLFFLANLSHRSWGLTPSRLAENFAGFSLVIRGGISDSRSKWASYVTSAHASWRLTFTFSIPEIQISRLKMFNSINQSSLNLKGNSVMREKDQKTSHLKALLCKESRRSVISKARS